MSAARHTPQKLSPEGNNPEDQRAATEENQQPARKVTAPKASRKASPKKSIAEETRHRAHERYFWRRQLRAAHCLNWVTAIGAVVAFVGLLFICLSLILTREAVRDGAKSADAATTQAQAALDANRPWIRAIITISRPIAFTEWNGHKGINVFLKIALKNYGGVPAVNVRVFPQIAVHPGNPRRDELDTPERAQCIAARAAGDSNEIGGIAIFPGDSAEPEIGVSGVEYTNDDPILMSIFGCIDYTYGNGRHGQTGFRMLLGKVVNNQVYGLPFLDGGVPEKDYNPSPELLASGYPRDPPTIAPMKTEDVYFKPDEGGNYAK